MVLLAMGLWLIFLAILQGVILLAIKGDWI